MLLAGVRCTGGALPIQVSAEATERGWGFLPRLGMGGDVTQRGGRRAPAAGIDAAHTDGLMQGSESEKEGPRRLLAPGRSDCGNSPVL